MQKKLKINKVGAEFFEPFTKTGFMTYGDTMTAGVQFNIKEDKEKKIVCLEGKMDALSTPHLEEKLLPLLENERKVLLDFSKVDYLNSAGMRLLLLLTKRLKVKGGAVVFFGMNGELSEMIKMAGFEKILHIYPNEGAALKAV